MRKRIRKVALLTGVGATAVANTAPVSVLAQEMETNTETNAPITDSVDSTTAAEMEGTNIYIDESITPAPETQESNEVVNNEVSISEDSSSIDTGETEEHTPAMEEVQEPNEIEKTEVTDKENVNSEKISESSNENASVSTSPMNTQESLKQVNVDTKATNSSAVSIDDLGLSVAFLKKEEFNNGGTIRYHYSLNSTVPVGLPSGLKITNPNNVSVTTDDSYVQNKKKNFSGYYDLPADYDKDDKNLIVVEFNGERREFRWVEHQGASYIADIQFVSLSDRELPEALSNQALGPQVVSGTESFYFDNYSLNDGQPLDVGAMYIEGIEIGFWYLTQIEIPELKISHDGFSPSQDFTVLMKWEFTTAGPNIFYRFESDNQFIELPKEVLDLQPPNESLVDEGEVQAKMPVSTQIVVEGGVWSFNGYNRQSVTVTNPSEDVFEFVGTWHFEEKTLSESSIIYKSGTSDPVENLPNRVDNVLEGSKQNVSTQIPRRTGWVFDKWTTTDVTVGSDGSFTMPATDVTFTATWKEDKNNDGIPDEDQMLTLIFKEGDHGKINDNSFLDENNQISLLPGETYPQVDVTPEEGYEFGGFFDENGNKYESGTEVSDDQKTETKTYTAKYFVLPEAVVSIPSHIVLTEANTNLDENYAGQKVTATFDSTRGDGLEAQLLVEQSFTITSQSGDVLTVQPYDQDGEVIPDTDGDAFADLGILDKEKSSLSFWFNSLRGKLGEKYSGVVQFLVNLKAK